jgi:hypothetical protein
LNFLHEIKKTVNPRQGLGDISCPERLRGCLCDASRKLAGSTSPKSKSKIRTPKSEHHQNFLKTKQNHVSIKYFLKEKVKCLKIKNKDKVNANFRNSVRKGLDFRDFLFFEFLI